MICADKVHSANLRRTRPDSMGRLSLNWQRFQRGAERASFFFAERRTAQKATWGQPPAHQPALTGVKNLRRGRNYNPVRNPYNPIKTTRDALSRPAWPLSPRLPVYPIQYKSKTKDAVNGLYGPLIAFDDLGMFSAGLTCRFWPRCKPLQWVVKPLQAMAQ